MSPLEIAEDWALEQWMLARETSEWEAARLQICTEEADRRDEINHSPGTHTTTPDALRSVWSDELGWLPVRGNSK
jgi:hypothetical protein